MTRLLILICLLYIIGYLTHAIIIGKTVYGDGIYYYSWVRSVVIDHDINFRNEYTYFSANQPITAKGIPGNKYAIGAPLIWYPFYLVTYQIFGGDGYGFIYQIVVGLISVLATSFALLLLYRVLEQQYGQSIGRLAVITIALGTNLWYYGSLDPVNSHALTFFWSTVALAFLMQSSATPATGLAQGLLMLTRTQEIVAAIPAICTYPIRKWPALIGSILLMFSIQIGAWYLVNGTFSSQYLGSEEGFYWFHPQILGVLFSVDNGVFLWTPVFLLGYLGLLLKSFRTRSPVWIGMTVACTLQLYIVASWSTWWQGASYSGRMFLGILPFITFGLAEVYRLLYRILFNTRILIFSLVFPLCTLNLIAIIYFLLRH